MQSVKQAVQDIIKNNAVVVFSKTFCPYCVEAKEILTKGGVEFNAQELDKMTEGGDMQNALEQISGQRTVPNIYIAGNHIGGCSDLKAKLKNG